MGSPTSEIAVYEIAVRTLVISEGNMSVNKYHKKSSRLVKASAAAGVYDNIKEKLTDEEAAVYKRGRKNAKSATAAKNASIVEIPDGHRGRSRDRISVLIREDGTGFGAD